VEIRIFTPGSHEGHSPICVNHKKDASTVDEGSQTFRPSANEKHESSGEGSNSAK
jgi:hypothetical protein